MASSCPSASPTSYVDQLYQLFISCDTSGSGLLGRSEVADLCDNLQLDAEQTFFIVDHLVGDDHVAKVDFDEFKEVFVDFLTQSQSSGNGVVDELQQQLSNSNPSSPVKSHPKRDRDPSPASMDCTFSAPSPSPSPAPASAPERKAVLSPETVENMGSSSIEDYLQAIWRKLGVGKDGYLNISELYVVCEHIGMIEMGDEVIQQLFQKLDCDQDGQVSFEEFLRGIFKQQLEEQEARRECEAPQKAGSASAEVETVRGANAPGCGSTSTSCSSSPSRLQLQHQQDQHPKQQDESFVSTNCYLLFIDPLTKDGLTDPETVVSLWESLGFSDGWALLKDLGFNPKSGRISIRVLSECLWSLLEEELVPSSQARLSLATFQHELNQLKINYDQVKEERDRLRINISEANTRADLLAQEVDDHHAKLEMSSQNKLMILEKKYQDQVRGLEEQLRKEREALATQSLCLKADIAKELAMAQDQEQRLKEHIKFFEQESKRLEKELQELNLRFSEVLRLNLDLQKEVEGNVVVKKKLEELESMQGFLKDQQYHQLLHEIEATGKQNKELQDLNDELLLEIENLRQQLEKKHHRSQEKHVAKRIKSRRSSNPRAFDNLPMTQSKFEARGGNNGSDNSTSFPGKKRGNDSSLSSDDNSDEEKSPKVVIKEMMDETHLMEVEEDEEPSTSLTISSEFELLKEINALKERLAIEIEERDKIINQKEEMYQSAKYVREEYEKKLKEEEVRSQVNLHKSVDQLLVKLEQNSLLSKELCPLLVSQTREGIYRVVHEWLAREMLSEAQDPQSSNSRLSMDEKLHQILCHFKETVTQPVNETINGSSDEVQIYESQEKQRHEKNVKRERESGSLATDQVITNLYVENTRLVKELKLNEEHQRSLEKDNLTLVYKYKVMNKLLSDITNSAN